ncbi:hypothetical protein [Thiosulfatimonas sediminis]|uniref:hypothetical protein n=1 Tax=Thiosulfatimonas sediminis TaxID=2675054 RepID=UPI0015647372|nr:hypothetical protein [Thiosulfatimonas sediminis]
MNGYPKIFLPALLSVLVLLWLSGMLLLPSFALFRLELDTDWLYQEWLMPISSGDYRHSLTTFHAITGWLMVWLIGALFTIHLRNHWRRKENRYSGLVFSLTWALLALSALGIYYFGEAMFNLWSSYVHTFLGITLPLFFWWHRHKGRQAVQ